MTEMSGPQSEVEVKYFQFDIKFNMTLLIFVSFECFI